MHSILDSVNAEVSSQGVRVQGLGDLRVMRAAEVSQFLNCFLIAIFRLLWVWILFFIYYYYSTSNIITGPLLVFSLIALNSGKTPFFYVYLHYILQRIHHK